MRNSSSKAEFIALVTFLIGATLVLTNGFSSRIFAQGDERDVFENLEPIGEVISEVLQNYVYTPDLDAAVEGAPIGIMNSPDRNSSFIPAAGYQAMREDTEGEFDGSGVTVRSDDDGDGAVLRRRPGPGAARARRRVRAAAELCPRRIVRLAFGVLRDRQGTGAGRCQGGHGVLYRLGRLRRAHAFFER